MVSARGSIRFGATLRAGDGAAPAQPNEFLQSGAGAAERLGFGTIVRSDVERREPPTYFDPFEASFGPQREVDRNT